MAASNSILSTVDLHSLFEYKDGELYWKTPAGGNGCVKVGSKAGTTHKNGYKSVKIKDVMVKNHRVIFMMFHGYLPDIVDHIDGNPSNNRIENLREATSSQNLYNSKKHKGKDGVKGVCWHKIKNKWIASCSVNGSLKHVGYFENKEDAEQAVKDFRVLHHGDFANHG